MNTFNSIYKSRGFNIDILYGDNEFNLNYLRDHIRPTRLNICAKGQYNLIIEGSIKTIRQGAHCTTHSVPYKRYTKVMKRSLVECIVHSKFTQKGSTSKRLGSNTILLGKPSTDFNINIFFFG